MASVIEMTIYRRSFGHPGRYYREIRPGLYQQTRKVAYNTSMNLLQKLITGIRFIGLSNMLQSISYARYRDRVEKQFGKKGAPHADPVAPQKVQGVNPFHNGAYFIYNDNLQLEVAFLSTHAVRLTWTPGRIAAKYAVGGDETIALRVELGETVDGWLMTAGALKLLVRQDGRVTYISGDVIVREDAPPVFRDPTWSHQAPLAEDAAIFGLGERTRFNLRPGNYHLWNRDPSGRYGPGDDPIYLNVPVYFCQQSIGSYLLFYENTCKALAGFGDFAHFHFNGGALRLYFIEGSLPNSLNEFTRFVGRAPMPPRWALGFHHCRWGYRSAGEVRKVLAGFKEHDLPLDAFHFDIDYMDGYRVFTVDPDRFARFDNLVEEMAEDGIKSVIILDPGVKIDEDYGVYTSGLAGDHFCKLPDGSPLRGLVWPGWVHFPDFTHPETRRWWGEYYQSFLEDGIAGFWHDMNEPVCFTSSGDDTFPKVTRHSFEGREGEHLEGHNIYGLQMNAAAHAALRNLRPEMRPWLLTRSGWAGVQRYAWKWTGDVESSWPALKMTIGTVLGLGISGIPYSGSDIGGFSGDPEPELYLRWFQMSALMAFFRNHTALGNQYSEPWQYGHEVVEVCRKMLYLRRKLIPYLYSLAWEALQTGAPIARPMLWGMPGDQRFWAIDDAFFLGEEIVVAPVVEKGAVTRKVLLPDGDWYHYWDDAHYPGGQEAEVPAPLDQIPFFVRAGSVIPMQAEETLALHIYAPRHEGQYFSEHYHDAGEGYGSYRLDTFTLHRRENRLFVQWSHAGNYPLPERVRLVLHGAVPGSPRVDEQVLDWPAGGVEVETFENLKLVLQ